MTPAPLPAHIVANPTRATLLATAASYAARAKEARRVCPQCKTLIAGYVSAAKYYRQQAKRAPTTDAAGTGEG
jgi:hypothetical protein